MPKTVTRGLLPIGLCLVPVFAQQRPESLELGKPVERELAGGQTHTYTLNLAANQTASVVATQKGIDLVLSVFASEETLN